MRFITNVDIISNFQRLCKNFHHFVTIMPISQKVFLKNLTARHKTRSIFPAKYRKSERFCAKLNFQVTKIFASIHFDLWIGLADIRLIWSVSIFDCLSNFAWEFMVENIPDIVYDFLYPAQI